MSGQSLIIMVSLLIIFNFLGFTAASELNLNELAFTLQESLLKASSADVSSTGPVSSEQLQRAIDLLMNLVPEAQSRVLEFNPPHLLDFGELAVAVPESRQVSLVSRSTAVIRISGFTLLDDQQFELSLPKAEIVLMPDQPLKFSVRFFPSSIGVAVNMLVLSTSIGRLQYFMRAEVTSSPYNLAPISYDSLLPDASFSHQLSIFNPHEDSLEIKSVATTHDYFKASFTDEDYSSWRILPDRRQQVAVLHLTTRVPGNYAGRVIIETNFGSFVVPVSLQILKTTLRLDQSYVNLGTLVAPKAPFIFDLLVTNLGKNSFTVLEIKPARSSSDKVKIRPTSRSVPSKQQTSLGSVSILSSQSGVVSGSVLIYTNETADPLEVKYRGEMDTELLTYNSTQLSFYPGNALPRQVELINPRSTLLIVLDVSTSSPELTVTSTIVPGLGPFSSTSLKVSYSGTLTSPRTLYIILQSSFNEIKIPVSIHNDKLECFVKDQPCSDTLDLGSIFFEVSRSYSMISVIELINSSPLAKKLIKIETPKGIRASIGGLKGPTNLKIESGESLLVEVAYEASAPLATRDPVITIKTERQHFSFKVAYTEVKGGFKVSPLSYTLRSPSQFQTLGLQVTNNYPVPVTIKNVNYDHKLLDVSLLKTVIKANSSIELAKVTFSINEAKLKRRIGMLTPLTYEDLSIHKDLELLWKDLSYKSFIINFTTDQSFSLVVPVTASALKAPLTNAKKLDFKTIFVDSLSEKFLELKNNLDVPVAYKVYIGPDYIKLPNKPNTCRGKVAPGYDDDEFEVVSPQKRTAETCSDPFHAEVQPVRTMSELQSPSPRAEMQRWDLFGKLSGLIGDLRYFSQPMVYYNTGDAFYLDCSREGIVPAKQSVLVGPLRFLPVNLGPHNATLYIKNNHTFIEEVQLSGTAESSSILVSGSGSSAGGALTFTVTLKQVFDQLTNVNLKASLSELVFSYDIELKNISKLPLVVKDILLNGHSCEAFGIKLLDCGEEFVLGVSRTFKTKLVFQPTFKQAMTRVSLLVVTDRGLTEVRLECIVVEEVLSEPYFKAHKWYSWTKTELLETELVVLLGLVVGSATLAYLVKEDRKLKQIGKAPQAKTESEDVLCEDTLVLTSEEPRLIDKTQPDLTLEEETMPVEPAVSKKKAKGKSAVPKFDTTNAKPPVLKAPEVIEIVATNKLLLKKSLPKRCNSESKDSNASTCYKAGTSTPTSEEESEDAYIDTYKAKALFGGPVMEFVSLEELLRD
jgi:hypothetical protein